MSASSSLRTRILHRDGPYELGVYELDRWTREPEAYARDALVQALFERGPFVDRSRAPTLEVELVAFEEVRPAKGRAAMRWTLYGEGQVLARGEASHESPAASDALPDVVAAISRALAVVAREVGLQVLRADARG